MEVNSIEDFEKSVGKYINPLNDWAFKYLFGKKELMMDFLNALIHNDDELAPKIIDIEYLNTSKLGEDVEVPGIIYDIRCKTNDSSEFIVEMQNRSQTFFQKRIDFYMSKAVVSQQEPQISKWRYNFNPVYGVFFMNFYDKVEPETSIVHCCWRSSGNKPKVHSTNMQYWKIQMPHFKNKAADDCQNNLEYWLYNIANMEKIKGELPFSDKNPIFKQLEKLAEYANLHKDDKWAYWQAMDQIAVAEDLMEQKLAEGLAKGRAQEREKAHEEKLQSAYKFFKTGVMTLEQIAVIMELDLDELSNYIIKIQDTLDKNH